MGLPSSGQLTMTAIYNELVNNGCCEAATYSLGDLSDCAGFSAPDAMSDFYGYSCGYSVAIDAKYSASPTGETTSDYAIYYSINYGSDTILVYGDSVGTTCDTEGTVSVPPSNSFQLGFAAVPSTGKGAGRQYNACKESVFCTTCPSGSVYCGTYNSGDGNYFDFTPTAGTKLYMTITVNAKLGVFAVCI